MYKHRNVQRRRAFGRYRKTAPKITRAVLPNDPKSTRSRLPMVPSNYGRGNVRAGNYVSQLQDSKALSAQIGALVTTMGTQKETVDALRNKNNETMNLLGKKITASERRIDTDERLLAAFAFTEEQQKLIADIQDEGTSLTQRRALIRKLGRQIQHDYKPGIDQREAAGGNHRVDGSGDDPMPPTATPKPEPKLPTPQDNDPDMPAVDMPIPPAASAAAAATSQDLKPAAIVGSTPKPAYVDATAPDPDINTIPSGVPQENKRSPLHPDLGPATKKQGVEVPPPPPPPPPPKDVPPGYQGEGKRQATQGSRPNRAGATPGRKMHFNTQEMSDQMNTNQPGAGINLDSDDDDV